MHCHYYVRHFAECRLFMLSVIRVNVVMLSVVAPNLMPFIVHSNREKKSFVFFAQKLHQKATCAQGYKCLYILTREY